MLKEKLNMITLALREWHQSHTHNLQVKFLMWRSASLCWMKNRKLLLWVMRRWRSYIVFMLSYIPYLGSTLVFVGNDLVWIGLAKVMLISNIFMVLCLDGGELMPSLLFMWEVFRWKVFVMSRRLSFLTSHITSKILICHAHELQSLIFTP